MTYYTILFYIILNLYGSDEQNINICCIFPCRSASGVTLSGIMTSTRWRSDLGWQLLLCLSMLIVTMQGQCSIKQRLIVLSERVICILCEFLQQYQLRFLLAPLLLAASRAELIVQIIVSECRQLFFQIATPSFCQIVMKLGTHDLCANTEKSVEQIINFLANFSNF